MLDYPFFFLIIITPYQFRKAWYIFLKLGFYISNNYHYYRLTVLIDYHCTLSVWVPKYLKCPSAWMLKVDKCPKVWLPLVFECLSTLSNRVPECPLSALQVPSKCPSALRVPKCLISFREPSEYSKKLWADNDINTEQKTFLWNAF